MWVSTIDGQSLVNITGKDIVIRKDYLDDVDIEDQEDIDNYVIVVEHKMSPSLKTNQTIFKGTKEECISKLRSISSYLESIDFFLDI